jgi:deoxyribodipyrimidine photo-lyase
MSSPVFLFVFRRDLRTQDNVGLARCVAAARAAGPGARVCPVFVFNPRQVDAALNPYRSARAVDFMVRCLLELGRELPELRLLRTRTSTGDDLDVLEAARARLGGRLAGVHFNADYTPFARERDRRIAEWCAAVGVACSGCTAEYSLVDPSAMPRPYQRFSPFYRRHLEDASASAASAAPDIARAAFAPLPRLGGGMDAASAWVRGMLMAPVDVPGHRPGPVPGREAALAVVRRIRAGAFAKYAETRDDLGREAESTTRLSAHLKFGCVGVREVFRAVEAAHGREHELARQLMWRAFYDQVAYHFPRVLRGQLSKSKASENASHATWWDERYGGKAKTKPDRAFVAWCEGRTGEPLVDAGMRELAATGRMHNRMRMVVASHLTRTMGYDWRLGERFFARSLVDYDPASNSGGWQWAAGGGAEAMPMFRKFSLARQAARHDPDGAYIVLWGAGLRPGPKERERPPAAPPARGG